MDLVRAGNDRAFEAIVLRYQRSLLRHCRRLLPAGRAEDAVQQALLGALEAMRSDQRELQLGPWLHRIAHNTAIDSLRRLDSHWEELDERTDGVEPTHAAVERRARFRSVVASMRSLPERQRRALVLRELEGRSYEEIAADLEVSGAGVRQLLNRARNAMRDGAGALVPPALVGRLGGSQAGVRIAELADPPGTSALLAKGTAALAAGAVALFAVTATPPGDGGPGPRAAAGAASAEEERRREAGDRSPRDVRATARDLEPRSAAGDRRGTGGERGGGPARGRTATGRRTERHGDGPTGNHLWEDAAPMRQNGLGGYEGGGGEDDSPSDTGRDDTAATRNDSDDADDDASGGGEDDDDAGGYEPTDDDPAAAAAGYNGPDDDLVAATAVDDDDASVADDADDAALSGAPPGPGGDDSPE